MVEASSITSCCGWPACCFFGFLHSGEITVLSDTALDKRAHLSFSDVSVDSTVSPKVLQVHIKASKTAPFRVGVDIFIRRTDNELCLVSAVLAYMSVRRPGPAHFTILRNSKCFTRSCLVGNLREPFRPHTGQINTFLKNY